MSPWSIGCNTDVVLGGKKTRWMFVKFEIDGCAVQLSIIRTIFLPSTRNFWSSFRTQFSKARFFWFANDEHWQLFSSSTCCGHSSESQLAISTFLLWGGMFSREDIGKTNQIRLRWKWPPICNSTEWLGAWFRSKSYVFLSNFHSFPRKTDKK